MPQGSVLSPLLFLLFRHDLATTLQSPNLFFVDDVQLVGSSGQDALSSDIVSVLNRAKNGIYCLTQGKAICFRETQRTLQYHKQSLFIINVVSKKEDLRIHVISDLKWSDQCAAAAKKARGELFILRSTLSCRDADFHFLVDLTQNTILSLCPHSLKRCGCRIQCSR